MSGNSVEGEEVVVCELDTRSRMGSGMVIDSGIRVPSLASVLEVVLEAAPLVPFQHTVRKDKDENDSDDDDNTDFGHLDEVTTEIVNHRGVNLIAEGDRGLLRNGKDGWVEGNAIEGVVDLLLGQLEGSVEAEKPMRRAIPILKGLKTYTALSFSLISATEGIELLSLTNAWVKSSGI